MPKTSLDAYRDLFTKKSFATIATVMPDGTPQVTPVWIDSDGQNLLVNSARGRVKDRNLERNAAVAVAILDPENPYRYVQVRGVVVSAVEAGADEHIDALARRYLGTDYPYRQPGEVRVLYKIRPTSVNGM